MSLHRKISEDEVSQTFNLKTLLGDTPSVEQQELFYNLVVEKMVDRTLEGKDVNKVKFKPYSKSYASMKGVPVNSVDMTLSGDMLNGIEDATGDSTEKVRIAIADDQTEKAFGHLSGMKGHKFIKKGKKRDFFGFKDKDDLEPIIAQVKKIAPEKIKKAPRNVEQQEFEELQEFNEEMFQETEEKKIDLVELRRAIQAVNLDFKDLS